LPRPVVYFGLIRPLNDRMAAATAKHDQNAPIAARRGAAQADVTRAQSEVAAAKRDYARYARRLFADAKGRPLVDVSDRLRALQQRWDLVHGEPPSKRLGPQVVSFLRKDRSVRIQQANISVPAPPQDPNAIDPNVIVLPLGSVNAEGTFSNLLRHAERWNQFNRLVLVEGLALAGNSPRLATSYTLTCYIYPQGDVAGPPIPSAGGAAGGGGAGIGGPFGGGGGGPYGGGGGGGGPYGGGGGPYGGGPGGAAPCGLITLPRTTSGLAR
jgi:hypothetical protein